MILYVSKYTYTLFCSALLYFGFDISSSHHSGLLHWNCPNATEVILKNIGKSSQFWSEAYIINSLLPNDAI